MTTQQVASPGTLNLPPRPASSLSSRPTPGSANGHAPEVGPTQAAGSPSNPSTQSTLPLVRRWWEQVFAASTSHMPEWVDFLTDSSVPWTKESSKHVLVPSSDTLAGLSSPLEDDEEVQDEIIYLLTRKARSHQLAGRPPTPPPLIHFEGNDIHVSGLSRFALGCFWKCRPVYRGEELQFVSKGIWYDDLFYNKFKGGAAMRKGDFINTFQEQYAGHSAGGGSGGNGLVSAFARFYQVPGESSEPIFSGEVMMFSNGIDVCKESKPFFVADRELKRKREQESKNKSCTGTLTSLRSDTCLSERQEPAKKSARVVANAADT